MKSAFYLDNKNETILYLYEYIYLTLSEDNL